MGIIVFEPLKGQRPLERHRKVAQAVGRAIASPKHIAAQVVGGQTSDDLEMVVNTKANLVVVARRIDDAWQRPIEIEYRSARSQDLRTGHQAQAAVAIGRDHVSRLHAQAAAQAQADGNRYLDDISGEHD